MKLSHLFTAVVMLWMPIGQIQAQSPTEGVLNNNFVDEATMKQDLLQMLANFSLYLKNDFNSVDNNYGYFNGERSGQNNEAGVRTNADLSMICAFLLKYAQPAGVTLPAGVTWNDINTMAKKSLAWAYGTHKANKLRQTTNNAYWGSTSASDYVWESSLWAMSVAYSAFFQWDNLTTQQKGYVEAMLKAECNCELNRSIPTGYAGDTKAEENGWEVNVLAATLGLFPNDPMASQWFDKMRQFAVNSYSHVSDLKKQIPFDPSYDGKTAADLFLGKNLYDDYTLQNHNMFHTSYQNVVMQELGESLLALKLFQKGLHGTEKWKSNSLMHNNQEVMDNVLNWLATADGELAMPNGNDWSLFLFDQITSYSTQACFNRDPHALMLENLAYKNIKARQTTTSDGSWLLRPDVSARRMGVEAHRVMMTFLMHDVASTQDLAPTGWENFQTTFAKTKYFPAQNIIRSMSPQRFTCFSWNTSLPDYSGVIVPNSPDKAKIMVPFRTHNTGNLLGVYSKADYSVSIPGKYAMFPQGYAMNGVVTVTSIPQAFCLYATSGNAVILLDALKANAATTVSSEQGGMMGISVDEFTKTNRTIYYNGGNVTTDGASYATWTSPWSNIDNYLGFVVTKHGETVQGAFGDKSNNNSITTAKIYPSYNGSTSTVGTSMNHIRGFVYYTGVNATETQALSNATQDLTTLASWPEGWHGLLVPDPDGTYYLLLTNLFADDYTPWENLTVNCPKGAPVFTQETTIAGYNATATFYCAKNYNIANELKVFVKGATELKAVQADENPRAAYLKNEKATSQTVTVYIIDENGNTRNASVTIPANATRLVAINGTAVTATTAEYPGNYRNVAYGSSVDAYSYDGAHLPFSVIDNDPDAYYLTLNPASSGTEYLTINLRNLYEIDKVVVTPQNGQAAPSSYLMEYADEEGNWKSVANVTTSTEANKTVLSFNKVGARFLKLKLNGSSQVAINKVAVYGAAPATLAEVTDPNDYTNYITNPDFEWDGAEVTPQPTGWTVAGSSDTGTRSTSNSNYAMSGSHGNYLFNTWWKGNPITQTTQVLPAGTYTLSAVVASESGARIFMIVDGDHSSYVDPANKAEGVTLSHTFTLDTDKAVTIGVVGSNNDKSYREDGYYWYKVDHFKLTRQEDATLENTYFNNPSFEKDDITAMPADATRGAYAFSEGAPISWTLSGSRPDVVDIMTAAATATDNNFGAPGNAPDGEQMFYMRVGWNNKSTNLTTTSTSALPAGKYRISFNYRTGYANSATSSFVFSCAGVNNSSVTFNKGGLSNWQTAFIDFTLTSPQTITPQIAITWVSGGSSFLMDHLQLEEIIDETDYSALHKQQIIANAGDATFLLKDPKCETAANTAWQGSTGAISLREHWSGEGYQNTYQERTATGTITQTISNMPAGTYKVVAALRANTGCTITPKLNGTAGDTFTGTGNNSASVNQINKNGVQMPYNDYRGFTTKTTGRGWQWGSATANLEADGNLTIAFDMNGSSWMSIDDVHLYYVSDGTNTFCESIDADANTNEVTVTKTVMADVKVENPNTIIYSANPVFTDNDKANNNLVAGTTMDRLVIYDGYPLACSGTSFSIANASYVRNMPTYYWGTLILPYDVESNENLQFYKMVGVNDTYMFFSPVEQAVANTPVVFQRLTENGNVPFMADNTIGIGTDQPAGSGFVTAEGWEAFGSFTNQTRTEKAYYIANDKFWLSNTSLKVDPFRIYFLPPDTENVKSLGISTAEMPTGIENVANGVSDMPDAIFTLDGRLVNTLQKGVNIIRFSNGNTKKVVR